MKNYYFESLKGSPYHEFLTDRPKKSDVLHNVKIAGSAAILKDSYNRAVIIETEDAYFLQSYDTIVCSVDKETGLFRKLWDGYTKTTMKHVNTFLQPFTGCLNTFNKKEWDDLRLG